MNELEHLVRSKAYLLPGLTMALEVEGKQTRLWKYERGMAQYFDFMLDGRELVAPLFTGERFFDEKALSGITDIEPGEGASWAIGWVSEGDIFADSHVNLIPTRSGGTHEAGFRSGIFDALGAFMDARAPRAQGREADRRRSLAARLLHALGAHRAHAVPRPDQGEAHHAPRRAPARDVRARRLRAVAERARRRGQEDRRARDRAGDGAPRQGQEGRAQEVERHRHAARQARGLRFRRHPAQRAVPGGRRFRRRLGQGGARQGDAGAAAAARQGAEHHVEGQPHGARQQGAAGDRHRDRGRSARRRREARLEPACDTAKSSS